MAIFQSNKDGAKGKEKQEKVENHKRRMKSPRGDSKRPSLSVDIMLQWMKDKARSPRSQPVSPTSPAFSSCSSPFTTPPESPRSSEYSPRSNESNSPRDNYSPRSAGELSPRPNSLQLSPRPHSLHLQLHSYQHDDATVPELSPRSPCSYTSSPPSTPTFTINTPDFALVGKSMTHAPEADYKPLKKCVSMEEMEKIKLIGVGASSKVYLVRSFSNLETIKEGVPLETPYSALKVISKEESSLTGEEEIMGQLNHPLIVQPFSSFEDDTNRYIHMPYVAGGELFYHLQKNKHFEEKVAQFYAAEIVLALEYIHSKNICYRDLKPENILLSKEGHIQLIDFGTAQYVNQTKNTRQTVGTLEYLAPEVLKMKKHQKEADWWALGILIYEMLTGHTPFYSPLNSEIASLVLAGKVEYPAHLSDAAKSLLKGLLTQKPKKRLGCDKKGAESIKQHPFFADVDWGRLLTQEPPIKIALDHSADTHYYED